MMTCRSLIYRLPLQQCSYLLYCPVVFSLSVCVCAYLINVPVALCVTCGVRIACSNVIGWHRWHPTWSREYGNIRSTRARGKIRRTSVSSKIKASPQETQQIERAEEGMELSHTRSVEEVLEHFSVKETEGLGTEEVARQWEKYGANGEADLLCGRAAV